MDESPSSPWPRRIRRIVVGVVALLAAVMLLFVSRGPAVEAGPRPTARDIAAAREVWSQVRAPRDGDAAARMRVDNEGLSGLAALANDATGVARFDAEVSDGILSGRTSVALPAGLWLNASATVTGKHSGFPAYRLKVGRVAFPPTASRWIAELGRRVLRLNGVDIPPLDDLVRQVAVNRQDVRAELALPPDNGMANGLILAGANLDQPLVSEIYCRIAAAQRAKPVASLPQLVARTFAGADAPDTGEQSRAAFVALSLIVVRDMAESLAPQAAELSKDCPRPDERFLLHGREDLAKHWAFSAALASVLGEDTAANLGEWKELDDSLPDGSGFSFVDIAADRAGLRMALRAIDPATASKTRAELGRATDESLLPTVLLRAPEGLPEASFVDRFGSLDRETYRRAIATIDRMLARERGSSD